MKRFKPIHLIPVLSLLGALALGATIRRAAVVLNFNAGELSPQMEGRADFAKYKSGARELQNMLVRSQGPVTRRPGTKYIAEVKDSNDPARIIPFEYSTSDAYIIEMGDGYLRFYRNGAQVTSGGAAYEVNAPWDANDLFEVQFAQDAQVMRFVHPDYPPYKLTRNSASHTDWTLAAVDFNNGPFLDENEDKTITITPSGVTGSITLTATDDIWDANHDGALWQVSHLVDSNSISGTFWGAWTAVSGDVKAKADEDSDGTYECNSVQIKVYRYQEYTVTTAGYWSAKFVIQRSYDEGTTWDDVKAFAYALNGNVLYTGSEQQDDAYYRVRIEDQIVSTHMRRNDEGICQFTVATDSFMRHGAVEITEVNDANFVSATVKTELASTDATWRWAEGAWSTYRGWPRTIEFHEQRCCYGGSTSWPQTIWASITASQDTDYDDFDAGEGLAADAWTYVLPGMNPIQWLVSAEYLMVGTTEGVGRLGAPDKPIDPTWPPIYRIQARNGCAYLDAAAAIDAILYVERGGQGIREVTYTYASDRYVAPDMTILAEHIARGGITQIDFAERPDPILWCVRADGVLLSFTYQKSHEVLAWARHITGQDPNDMNDWDDFESVAVIPGTSNRADGTAREDDEVWVVVQRTVDGNEVRYVEQFQPLDWGDDPNYCWFVDCGLGDALSSHTYTGGEYPTLQELDAGEIPASPAEPSLTAANTAVSNAIQLQAMSGSNKYYLKANIDLTGVTWTPISSFSGVLDGNNFTISNLSHTNTAGAAQSYWGLFASLNNGAEVYDLTLDGFEIDADASSWYLYLGALAGVCPQPTPSFARTKVTLSNVQVTNCVLHGGGVGANGSQYVGGLIGRMQAQNDTVVTDCQVADCSITGGSYVGGLIGYLNGSSTGAEPNGPYAIMGCGVTGTTVTAYGGTLPNNIGGLIGYCLMAQKDCSIHSCTTEGTISCASAMHEVGGMFGTLAAQNAKSYVVQCDADMEIVLAHTSPVGILYDAGGFFGYEGSTKAEYIDCSATGGITSSSGYTYNIGGFTGLAINWTDNTYLHCWSTGEIEITASDVYTPAHIGGFFGTYETRPYEDSSVTEYVSDVNRCFTTSAIRVSVAENAEPGNAMDLGGFCGLVLGTVEDPMNETITHTATFTDCYSWTQFFVTGQLDNAILGGFIATGDLDERHTFVLDNTYMAPTADASGSTTTPFPAANQVHGYALEDVGTDPNDLTATNSFWDTEASSESDSVFGTGHATSWMQTQSNYEAAGWDFNEIWVIDSNTTTDANALDGADALIGESVCVYADGRPLGSFTVDGDGVIDVNAAYSTVIAGLNYYSILETMPLVDPETVGRPTAIQSVAIDFLDTMGARVGSDFDHTANWKFFERNTLTGSARDPNDGTVALPYKGNTMATGDVVRIYGTTNYNGIWTLAADTNNVELRITDTYAAETFDGTETVDPNEAIEPFTGYKPFSGYTPFLRGMTRQPVIYLWEWEPIPMTIRSITANMEVTFE